MNKYEETGRQIGSIVDKKNRAYGDSFDKCAEYMKLLYPHGIKHEQYIDALALIRDFDKSMRIATDRDAFGEDPWSDKAGYAILRVYQNDNKKTKQQQIVIPAKAGIQEGNK